MSQNSILLEKSLHFSVRIVKLHRLLHRHEDDLSAELLKHAAAIGSAVSCADCALSRRDLAESLNEALRETAQTEYWLRLLTLTDDVDVRTGASLLSDCTELHRLLTAAASAANLYDSRLKNTPKACFSFFCAQLANIPGTRYNERK